MKSGITDFIVPLGQHVTQTELPKAMEQIGWVEERPQADSLLAQGQSPGVESFNEEEM